MEAENILSIILNLSYSPEHSKILGEICSNSIPILIQNLTFFWMGQVERIVQMNLDQFSEISESLKVINSENPFLGLYLNSKQLKSNQKDERLVDFGESLEKSKKENKFECLDLDTETSDIKRRGISPDILFASEIKQLLLLTNLSLRSPVKLFIFENDYFLDILLSKMIRSENPHFLATSSQVFSFLILFKLTEKNLINILILYIRKII